MPVRWVSILLAVLAVLAVASCSGGGTTTSTTGNQPAPVPFTRADVPGVPLVLATDGDALLVGVRRDKHPGLLRRSPDGTLTEIGVHGETPYGLQARWYSIDTDGSHIVGLGGERGGAHGNVRWSAWLGSATTGIAERMQAFSTFGGYGAGELVAAVQTPVGPALVGTWQSARAGLDAAVWTADAENWSRRDSAGTVLESTPDALNFPIAATALGQGIVVAGWQLAGGTQRPVVWRSTSGVTGWNLTPLPDAGHAAAAMAVRCSGETCTVTGRVDGMLALWRLSGTAGWQRLTGVPPVPVGDKDRLTAPLDLGGTLTQLVVDHGQVQIVQLTHDRWTTRPTTGPAAPVTAATAAAGELYLLSGPDEDAQTLWHARL